MTARPHLGPRQTEPMKQVLQSLRANSVELVDVPAPRVAPGHLLIRTVASVISPGTERMLTDFAKAGLLGKARQQPDRVRQVVGKARTDGLAATVEAVRARLDEPVPLGYANAGHVLEVGTGVTGFSVGDLVASNGPHAEVVVVPATLCARVPPGVEPAEAATATLAAVALQGVRLAQPTLGERFVVSGLGFIGLLVVQLLAAHGCAVLGLDPDPARRELAAKLGAETAAPDAAGPAAEIFSRGRGVDGVIVAASTPSSEPIRQAAQMCRKRGRIVLVGVTGLELSRPDFYEKELTFSVSCSYGPGRHDPTYEERANDYPVGFVRWTAGRNLEAALDIMAAGRLDVDSLLTHRFPLDDAARAYDSLTDVRSGLGFVLEYPETLAIPGRELLAPIVARRAQGTTESSVRTGAPRIGVIGCGQFATRVILPVLQAAGVDLVGIAGRAGPSAALVAERFGFAWSTNDPESLLADPEIDAVFVLTRHDSHPRWVVAALEAGKHILVEKPLAINREGLNLIVKAWESSPGDRVLLVGFNRRFARITQRMTELLGPVPGPRAVEILVNAGPVPADHWTRDPHVGGGRIVGEACHFVDLGRHLAGSPIAAVHSTPLGSGEWESAAITLAHENGSVSTIGYYANGSKRFPKERVTVLAGGRVLVNDNFRLLSSAGWGRPHRLRSFRQDKGHSSEVAAFLGALRSGNPAPVSFQELIEVTLATLRASESDP